MRRGFTLVEVMMAATIFAGAAIGIYAMLVKSYQVMALGRCRDQARAVLRTYADQFQRLQTTRKIKANQVEVPGSSPVIYVPAGTYSLWLFVPTGGSPSGRGLVWGSLNDVDTSTNVSATAYLPITLGPPESATPARVTRDVSYLNSSTGSRITTQVIDAAGFMITGTFTVTYSLIGKSYSESITVVRAAP